MTEPAKQKVPRFHTPFPDLFSGLPFWQGPEHALIAKGVTLKGRIDNSAPFTLENGLSLTYAQIHMLAGDFYGTDEPISFTSADDGKQDDHDTRFNKAFDTLAKAPGSVAKAQAMLGHLAKEEEFIKSYVDQGKGSAKDAWVIWNFRDLFELEGDSEIGLPGTGVDFETLLKTNVDHFGEHACLAYKIGHSIAIATARAGDLEKAYAQNAFAEHFLQDYFASGHMRTPRKQLMVDTPKNICANMMHNEDCNNGLNVIAINKAPSEGNPGPVPMTETYQAFGDDSLLQSKNSTNLNQAIYALQMSANEIYDAYQHQPVPEPPSAFLYTATPESIVREDNNPCPMFWLVNNELQMRLGLVDANPSSIPVGNWQFESVVQSKVLPWWIPTLLWNNIPESYQSELAWSCVAWTIAPSGYYRDVAYNYLLDLVKRLWKYISHIADFETEVLAKAPKA